MQLELVKFPVMGSVGQGAITSVLLVSPARSAPNHAMPRWPVASASSHGKRLAFPTVGPLLTRRGALHVEAWSLEVEIQMFDPSDHTAYTIPESSTASAGNKFLALDPAGCAKTLWSVKV